MPPVDPGASSFVSPARWDYHPPAPSSALAALKLPDGGCVFTTDGGQRWSSATTKLANNRVVCAGKAEASFAVAPEDLTSAIRRADGSWIYVGESGSLYEASEMLGAFTRTVSAPEPLAKVAAAGAAVLAATQEGRILRWEPAKGWRSASDSRVLAGARIFDLAVTDGGKILALGFPEALFASEDDGATWTAASAPTVGARRLGRTASGELGAQGIYDAVVWRGGSSFVRASEKIVPAQAALDVDVGPAPSFGAVQGGHAVLDGDRYYEINRPEGDANAWALARGHLEGRLETIPIPGSEHCSSMRLGARGRIVYVACVFSDGSDIAAELRRSTDGATTWSDPVRLVTADTDQLNIAVSPDGSAMVTGACRAENGEPSPSGAARPASSARSAPAVGSGCKLSSPVLVREAPVAADAGAPSAARDVVDAGDRADAGARASGAHVGLRAMPSSAPQLSGAALATAFSTDGRSAYFLGRRGKDDRINLFVSHDGGETFAPRALQSANAPHLARHHDDDDDESPQSTEGPETFDVDESSALRPGDDGTLGMTLMATHSGFPVYVTVDDDGRVLGVGGPPLDEDGSVMSVLLAGSGRRVLALPSTPPDNGPAFFWESLDGGTSWDRQPMPQALVREYSRGTMGVTCALGGCLLGETIARVGWGGTSEVGDGDRPADPPPASTPAVLAPIVCDLSPATKWSRVDDVFVPGSHGSPLPTAREAMRGRSVWSALSLDRATGALTVTSATLPESGDGDARVVKRPLLGAKGPHTATAISSTQYEGYAAVRVAYAVDAHGQPKIGAPLRNVEIAWENFFEGASARARVPDAGALERGDVSVVDGGIDLLNASLVSITSRGFFVRPHVARGPSSEEIFVDPAGRVDRRAPVPWPSSGPLGSLDVRGDAVAIAGELLGVGLVQDPDHAWSVAVLAKRAQNGSFSYVSDALLPPRAQNGSLLAYTTWASSTKSPAAVSVLVADPARGRAQAHFVAFRSDGTFAPAEPVPTLYDLGERPRPCTPSDRASTPRTAMFLTATFRGTVLFPGARHPVLVHEPRPKNAVGVDAPLVLLTSSAILHGTPASPCLAAFQAESATSSPLGAVLPGDLSRSWLFRHASTAARPAGKRPEPSAAPALEFRPMTCRYDPAARLPDVVWSQPGTSTSAAPGVAGATGASNARP